MHMKNYSTLFAISLAILGLPGVVMAGDDKKNNPPSTSWWQDPAYAKLLDQNTKEAAVAPTARAADTSPDWLKNPDYGWQPNTEKAPETDIYVLGGQAWSVQAREALGEIASDTWREAINKTEQRLVDRLAKAKAAGEPYLVWVNLPAYKLRVLDTQDGSVVMESRVIIGKVGRETPLMDTRIVNLKFNPDWSPPKSAPGKSYTPPGPKNPLGRVRFSTDNGIGIYLHDTNNHAMFNTQSRAYSLGCVRVEKWQDLALLLSGQDDNWVAQQTRDWKTRWVDVPDVPVLIDYQRIDFNDDGTLIEHADVYRREKRNR